METSWTISNAHEKPDRENPMAADLVIGYSAPDPFVITIETVAVTALRMHDWNGVLMEEFTRHNGTLSVASAAVLAAKFLARLQSDTPLRTQLQQWCRRECVELEEERLAARFAITHP
jgi:hypothetical protein